LAFVPLLGVIGRLVAALAAIAVAATLAAAGAPRAVGVAAAVPRAMISLVTVEPRAEPLTAQAPTPTPAPPPSPVPLPPDDEKVVLWLAWEEALNREDIDGLLALMTDDVLWQGDSCQPCIGTADLRAYFERMIALFAPQEQLRLPTVAGSGDHLTGMIETATRDERDRGAPWRLFQRSVTVRHGLIASVCRGDVPCEEKYASPPFRPPPWTVPSLPPAPLLPADPLLKVTVPRELATGPSFIADGRVVAGMAVTLVVALSEVLGGVVFDLVRRRRGRGGSV
jgi:ketosteroid isomerase-like protein